MDLLRTRRTLRSDGAGSFERFSDDARFSLPEPWPPPLEGKSLAEEMLAEKGQEILFQLPC